MEGLKCFILLETDMSRGGIVSPYAVPTPYDIDYSYSLQSSRLYTQDSAPSTKLGTALYAYNAAPPVEVLNSKPVRLAHEITSLCRLCVAKASACPYCFSIVCKSGHIALLNLNEPFRGKCTHEKTVRPENKKNAETFLTEEEERILLSDKGTN